MKKAKKLNPEMGQLIEENRVLKEENQGLINVIEGYDRELISTADVLEKVTDKLNKTTDALEDAMGTKWHREV
jgi:regulator of replication initiation timing